MADVLPNHLSGRTLESAVPDPDERAPLEGRAVVVKRLEPLPIEAVVRGYLIGSGWRDYRETGAVCGIELPPGLEQAAALPEPLFTPATKDDVGDGRVKPAGEWNTMEIAAQGKTLTLWVNGAVTCRFEDCGAPYGFVGVEGEGYRIEFRNLKVKEID